MLGRSREEQNQKDFAALRAEVDHFAADLRELTSTLGRLGARNIAEPVGDRVRETADKVRRKVHDTLARPSANPDRLAGLAFCAGFAIGLLLRARSHRPSADAE
mgnify:CR=1 FL=1